MYLVSPLPFPFPPVVLPVHKVTFIDLVLPQVIWSVLILALATMEWTTIDLWWSIGVLQLFVFRHASSEPFGVTFGTITAYFT